MTSLIVHHIWVAFGYFLVVTFGGLALWRGGWAERTAAIVVLFDWFLTPHIKTTYDPGLALILLDSAEVAALFIISVFSRRIWTVFITCNAAGGLLSHFANVIAPDHHKMYFAYITIAGLMGGIFVALSLGGGVLENEIIKKAQRDALSE